MVGIWNINSVRSKFEDEITLNWLLMHDIVVLVEIMISKLPHVPGFVPIIAKTVNSRRGGVAVLVKSCLYPDLCHLDLSVYDQIWFSFDSMPGVRFCGAYITPSTSPYFRESDIANLQAKTSDQNMKYVIAGDFNARVGEKVNNLVLHNNTYAYSTPVDSVLNDNGKKLLAVCKDSNLVIINNLVAQPLRFPGAMTFRK